MAISGQQLINIGAQNQPANSDSLYLAFNKIQNNFTTLFNSSSTYVNFVGNLGIDTVANSTTGTVTFTNTGVTQLLPGTGITLSGSNGNVTVSISGNATGALVAGVTNVAIVSDTLQVNNSPIVSSGNIKVELPRQANVVADTYIAPTITVDDFGRITDIQSIESVGTVTSVGLSAGNGIAIVGGPITSNGTMTIYNTGVTQLKSGSGITLSGSNGVVTISAGLDKDAGTVTRVGISSNTLTVTGGSITTAGNIVVDLPDDIAVAGNITGNALYVEGKVAFGQVDKVSIKGGSSGYVLSTDGTGNLHWVAQIGAAPGDVAATGANTQVQFNDAGLIGANANLTFNKTSGTLTSTVFAGSGAGLTNIPAANLSGNISSANVTTNITAGGNIGVGGNATVNGTLTVNGAALGVTATTGASNTMLATTAFVATAVSNAGSTKANIQSPVFTGVPQAPTASQSAPASTQIATTEYVKSAVNAQTATLTAATVAVPTGGIIMWSGAVTNIPVGWRLCDGAGGTPDLRGRFVIGAGGTYGVGYTGGLADQVVVSHTHTATSVFTGTSMPTHSHGINDPGHIHGIQDPGHSHNVNNQTAEGPSWIAFSRSDLTPYGDSYNANGYGVNQTTGDDRIFRIVGNKTGVSVMTGQTNMSVYAGTAGTPSGTVATTLSTTGASGAGLNLPPYYALCFIMKT